MGFEPRDLEEPSESSTSLGGGNGGDGPSGLGGTSDASGANSGGSGATTATSIAPDNTSTLGSGDSGGAGETSTDLAETAASSGGHAGSTAGNGGTGDGGSASSTTEASSSGGSSSSSDTTGGSNDTTSNTGSAGGNGGMGGTGGAGTGTSGSDSTTSTGGTENASSTSGSGGTGGNPLCEVKRTFDASESEGVYPSAIMLGRNTGTRPWDVTWVEDDKVYLSARGTNGSTVLGPTVLDESGSHSTSVIATQGASAFVAYGEVVSSDASIVMHRSTPVTFDDVLQGDTGALGGASAPQVVGVALQGNSTDALVAAIDAGGAALLALFQETVHDPADVQLGTVAALAPFDLDGYFGLAYIQDGSLALALAEPDLSGVETLVGVPEAEPIAYSPHSLSAAAMSGGAALVWEQDNGVYLTTVDTDGDAEVPVRVSFGQNDILPRVDVIGAQLYVSWIDADAHELYLRRFPTGLSGSPEDALKIAESVADSSYGLAADPFTATKTLALIYATERLKVSIVTCPNPT